MIRKTHTLSSDSKVWMIIFLDLITLLLTFFVLIYSMTSIPSKPSAIDGKDGLEKEDTSKFYGGRDNASENMRETTLSLSYVHNIFKEQIKKNNSTGVIAEITPKGLVLSLDSDNMFSPGQALIMQQSSQALVMIANMLNNIPNQVIIEGHTDPREINTIEFSSNTELAMARAISVAEFIQQAGFSEGLRIYARGAGDFQEISRDLPQDERYKRSRRVDVIILPEKR